MTSIRERSGVTEDPMASGLEKFCVGKVGCVLAGGSGASSGNFKVLRSKKDKNKRRLITSDSDSDDFSLSPHCRQPVNGSESVDIRSNSTAGRMRSKASGKGGIKGDASLKKNAQHDVDKYREDDRSNLKRSVCLRTGRKRNRDVSQHDVKDDCIPLKKIKVASLRCTKNKRMAMDAERMKLDSVRCGVGKSLIRVSRLPDQKQTMGAEEGDGSLTKTCMQSHLRGNGNYELRKGSRLEHDDENMYQLPKHNMPSSKSQHYSVSSDGTSLRLQGKGGVLRLLPNNRKLRGQTIPYLEGESDEVEMNPGSSGRRSKSTFIEAQKPIKKSLSFSLPSESAKTPDCFGGGNQSIKKLSSEGRRSLNGVVECFTVEEVRKNLSHSSFPDQVVTKQFSPNKSARCLKKRDSPVKVEKRQDPQHSGDSTKVKFRCTAVSDDRESFKTSSPLRDVKKCQDTRKCLGRSTCIAECPEDRKALKNPGCSKQISSHMESKGKGLKLKKLSDHPSPHRNSEGVENPCIRGETEGREAGIFITKTMHSSESCTTPNIISRRTEKQQLRDQIKNMLLDAGWKIEMRPRRGRNYEDSVYVSPQGTGYWSITKAYSVLQEQCNKSCIMENNQDKELHGQLFQDTARNACDHNGVASQFSAIPSELLKILKRNVVQKRRRRIEDDRKDGKWVTSSKSAKSKKGFAIKGRMKENAIIGTSRKKNKKGRGCTLLARRSNLEADSEDDDYIPYKGKRTVLAWMIDSGTVPANGKVKYMNRRCTRTMMEGQITRDGIHCSCCSKILTISKFAVHAGSKLSQPYANIFVEESGASLLQCQVDAWDRQNECDRSAFHKVDINDDPNDDTCAICGDGGDLICCDSCPSTFHLNCVGIQMLPSGDWNCINCMCRFCGEANINPGEGDSASRSLLLSCGQCEGKYHQACITGADTTSADSKTSCLSFCGRECRMVSERLKKLLGVKNDLDAGFSWTLVRRFDDEPLYACSNLAQRAECNSKIAVALAVMNECFLPIIDRRSGINLIHNIIYNRGSNFSRLSYSGFYTFVLERGDEIISAASIRIHGTRLAEMPFIGTRDMYRRQGMCRRLMNVIEETLSALRIGKLVIPAISELMHTWTVIFGFKPLADDDKQEIRSMNMLVFPDTGLLYKALLEQGNTATKEEGLKPMKKDTALVSNNEYDPLNNGIGCGLNRDENEIEELDSEASEHNVASLEQAF